MIPIRLLLLVATSTRMRAPCRWRATPLASATYCDLRSVAETCTEVPFDDWAFAGPRTTRWWVLQVARAGNGVVSRHQTWKHENNLRDDDHFCQPHEVFSEIVELLACVDQVDPGNLCGLEAAARHLQFVEYESRRRRIRSGPTATRSSSWAGPSRPAGR